MLKFYVSTIEKLRAFKDESGATAIESGMPYDGIDNLRPESKAAVQEFLFMMNTPQL